MFRGKSFKFHHFLFILPAYLTACTKALPSNLAMLNLSVSHTSAPSLVYAPIPSPLAWWKFDETSGTTVTSAVGNLTGTLANSASFVSGQSGNAVLVGNSAHTQTYAGSPPPSISLGTVLPASFTLSFWVKPSGFNTVNPGGGDSNFLMGSEVYNTSGFRSGFDTNGIFYFWTTESGGTITLADSQAAPVGSWTQYVISYQNQIATLFRNGSYVTRVPGTFIPTANHIAINTGIGGVSTFWGAIDDLKIYNQALTPQNISSGQFTLGTFGSAANPLQISQTPPVATPTLASYFGMTIHRLFTSNGSGETPFPSFPFQTFRFWDVVNWQVVQPSQGTFYWTSLDANIATAKQNGVSDYIFTLGTVPTWASTVPGDTTCAEGAGACDAPTTGTLQTFLTAVVKRYCGTIKYYESWNEPDGPGFWVGTHPQLLAIASQVYQIAKDPANCGCTNGVCSPGGGVNPNQVILSSVSNIGAGTLTWLNGYLTVAGPTYPYADIVGFHGYGYTNNPEAIADGVSNFKQVLAQHGLGSLPIWDTELGWGTTTSSSLTTQATQASWIIRLFMAQLTAGVDRSIWYAYDNCAWGTMWGPACDPNSGAALDSWTGTRQPGTAYSTLQNWIVGTTLNRCEIYENGLWACLIQKNNYTGWVMWSSMGTNLTVAVPTGMTDYRNWQNTQSSVSSTITIGASPILLEN